MSLHTGTVTRPRFESRPYRPAPGRREFIHGRIQDDLPKMNRLWFWVSRVIMGTCSVYALSLWIVK